jgi:hypothetical protein
MEEELEKYIISMGYDKDEIQHLSKGAIEEYKWDLDYRKMKNTIKKKVWLGYITEDRCNKCHACSLPDNGDKRPEATPCSEYHAKLVKIASKYDVEVIKVPPMYAYHAYDFFGKITDLEKVIKELLGVEKEDWEEKCELFVSEFDNYVRC